MAIYPNSDFGIGSLCFENSGLRISKLRIKNNFIRRLVIALVVPLVERTKFRLSPELLYNLYYVK